MDIVKVRKKKTPPLRIYRIVNFAVPKDHRVKIKESEKRNKYLDVAREKQKKKTTTMEYEGDDDTICNRCARNNPQRIGKGSRRLINQIISRDHPYYSIVKIGEISERSLGDLKRLSVTQTPVKSHQLMLV